MWRDIMPAPRKAGWGRDYDFSTTPASFTLRTSIDEVSRENGGEDWWYDICPLKDPGGNLIGYAAAGYNTMPNWGFEDQLGCGSEVDPYEHNELETNLNRKGFLRCWVARYDLSGNMMWCKSSLAGTFYGITQASDGSILAVGEASHNRMGEDLVVGHPYLGYNPGLNTVPVDLSTVNCAQAGLGDMKPRPVVMKYDLNGNLDWMNLYGYFQDHGSNSWSATGRLMGITPINLTSGTGYYLVMEHYDIPDAPNPTVLCMRINEDGTVIDRQAILSSDPERPSDATGLYPYNISALTYEGDEHLVISGAYARSGGLPRAFLWHVPDASDAPYTTNTNMRLTTESPSVANSHHEDKVQISTDATLIDQNGELWAVWPVLSDYLYDTPYNPKAAAILRVHGLPITDLGPGWTTDLGEVRAYDLRAGITRTSDGALAVVSSRWAPGYNASQPFCFDDVSPTTASCLTTNYTDVAWAPTNPGDGGAEFFNYWNTDPVVFKLEASNGSIIWETQFDAEPGAESGCYPEDMRKNECMYQIVEAEDGGLVICGNTSHNFDDAYLVKLGPDCQVKVNYEPLTLVDGAYTLTSNETWSTDRKILGTIIVPDGKILTINNNATIRFADSEQLTIATRLVVEPGGVLNVINATLTSLDQCPNSMWDGIVVQGDANATQGSGTVGLDQGYVYLNNSTVENARTAVVVANAFQMGPLSNIANELRSGGIVRTQGATFRNNVYDVSFSPYENHINSVVANNRSNFTLTEFITEGQLADPGSLPIAHATLSLVRGIIFSGCTFSNDLSGQLFLEYGERGWGIHSISSSFRVQAHCTEPPVFGVSCSEVNLVRSRFEGLHRGIRATTMDLSRTFSVSKAVFTNVHFGIRMDGIQDAAITESSFAIPKAWSWDNITTMYGIYSEQCTGYRIESNSFASMDGDPEPRRAGIAIRNSGDNYNTFYNNSFDGLKLGSVIQGDNANEKFTVGLEVKCNDFGLTTKNKFDVALTSYDATVQRTQGGPADPLEAETWANPAGNRFSAHNETDHPESDWYVDASNFVEYFYHTPTSGNKTKPEYSNPFEINLVDALAFWPGKSVACPTAFTRPKTQLREASGLAHEGWEGATADYDATKDDGDTYTLLGYVSDPGNSSSQVRNALQSVAPKVGTEVWQAAFERSPVLQPWHITQALLSNSPLQGEVLKMVDTYGLPTYYADLVYNGQSGDASLLAKLQAEVAKYAAAKAEALTDLGHQSWLDSLDLGGSLDSLKRWHMSLPSDNSGITIAGVLSAQREHAALELLAQTEEMNSTAPELYAVVKRFATAEQQGGWNSNVADIAYLEGLAAQREPIGSALAYGWLEALGHKVPDEIILHPDEGPKRSRQHREPIEWPSAAQLEIFPNPSNGPAFVAFETPVVASNASLRVVDLSGRELFETRVGTGPGIHNLVTDDWSNGVYMVELRVDGAAYASTKLIVQR